MNDDLFDKVAVGLLCLCGLALIWAMVFGTLAALGVV